MLQGESVNYMNLMQPEEGIVFLKILSILGQCDNNFDETEKEFITDLSRMMGLDDAKTNEILSCNDEEGVIKAASTIKNRAVALKIIKEACFLANSDDDLSEKEVVFIGKVAQAMGIELEKVEQISQWVIDCLVLQEQGKIIMEEN